jgi:hypothetical protein
VPWTSGIKSAGLRKEMPENHWNREVIFGAKTPEDFGRDMRIKRS